MKGFHLAKLRLAPALAPEERSELAQAMATHVLSCAGGLPVAVVCDDADVAGWAERNQAILVWQPKRGLNRAVEAGVDALARLGARRVIVAHADLPLARDLRWVGRFAGVTLVPDHRGNGTNVISVPVRSGFRFSYGRGSFLRHAAEARRLDLALRVVREPSLAHDVDRPGDLARSGLML